MLLKRAKMLHITVELPRRSNIELRTFLKNSTGRCITYDVITLWPDMTRSNFFHQTMANDCPNMHGKFHHLLIRLLMWIPQAENSEKLTHASWKPGRRLYLLWRHNSVTWNDPVKIFYQKMRKGCPIGCAKIQRAAPSRLATIPEKPQGGGGCTPPCTGEG